MPRNSVTVGLARGKFAPLHRGHQHVIETALREMDHVIVVIYDASHRNGCGSCIFFLSSVSRRPPPRQGAHMAISPRLKFLTCRPISIYTRRYLVFSAWRINRQANRIHNHFNRYRSFHQRQTHRARLDGSPCIYPIGNLGESLKHIPRRGETNQVCLRLKYRNSTNHDLPS